MVAGCGTAVLAGLRSFVVVVAMSVIGLGAWILHTIHDVEVRGGIILDLVRLDDAVEVRWRDFFDTVVNSQMRIWIAIATGCFTFLAGLFVFLSLKVDRLKVSRYLLGPLEVLSMLAMAGAFATSLSLAIKLGPLCSGLDSSGSADLVPFGMLCPLSQGYSAASGIGWFVLAITSLAAVIETCKHARQQKCCSFEPTASALGMNHGYQAVTPQMPRTTIPTLYDPRKPIPGMPSRSLGEDEQGIANNGADMGRRDSRISVTSQESERDISEPLGLEKPAMVHQMRPARPWSEAPKRR